jgi:hypothetical protein
METKVCTKCGRELPRTSFYVNNHMKDGLQSYCKECHCKATTEAARRRRAKAKAEEEASKTAPVLPVVSVMDMGCIYNLAQVEKQTIISCVNNNPNKTFTEYAELLGISERSFYRKIHQYDLREVVNTVRSYSEMEMADAISGVHLAKVKTLADYEDKDLLEELWKRDYDGNIWKIIRKETTISKLFGKKK